MKQSVILIDNSIAFTGAFRCALNEAELLKDSARFIFVIPSGSTNKSLLEERGITFYELPLLEIKKSVSVGMAYLPALMKISSQLMKIIEKENPSLIQVNDVYNLLGVMAKLRGYKGKLVTLFRFLPSALPGPLRKIWVSLALKHSDVLVAVSEAVKKELPSHSKIKVVYDPVILEETLASPKLDSEETRFIYVGNYIRGKGQDHALAAFSEALKENNRIKLIFAGGDMGLEKNKAFKKELEDKANAEGISDKVEFRPFQKNIEPVLKSGNVALNFSESESFSMTVAEAQFYGLPVIASRCGGPEEIVQNERTGILVNNRDREAMKAAMLKLASSPALRATYGRQASASIKERFGTAPFINFYKSLLS